MNRKNNLKPIKIREQKQIEQKLGWPTVTAITIGGMIGPGLFILMTNLFKDNHSGIIMILSWLIGFLIITPVNIVFIKLAQNYQESGSGYSYLRNEGWNKAALYFGWINALFLDPLCLSILLNKLKNFIQQIFLLITPLLFNGAIIAGIISVCIFLLTVQIHLRPIKLGGKYNSIATLIKISFVILLIISAFLINFDPKLIWNSYQRTSISPQFAKQILEGGVKTVLAYAGINYMCYMSSEFNFTRKNLFLTTITSICSAAIIYLLLAVACAGHLTPETSLGKNEDIIILLFSKSKLREWWAIIIPFFGVWLSISTISSLLQLMPRLSYQMAKKGDLPKALSKINKAKVPYLAVLLVSGLTLLLRFTLKEEESLQLFSRLIYGTFALTCLGYFSLCHRKKKRKETLFSVFAFIITAGVSSVIFLADFHLYYLIILGIFIVAVEIKQIIPINLGRK